MTGIMSMMYIRSAMTGKSVTSLPFVIILPSHGSRNYVAPFIRHFRKQININLHPYPSLCNRHTITEGLRCNTSSKHTSSNIYMWHYCGHTDTLRVVPSGSVDMTCRSYQTLSNNYMWHYCGHTDTLRVVPSGSVDMTCRSYKSKKDTPEVESSSDSESDEDDTDTDDDDSSNAPRTFKSMMLHVKSLRVDNIVSQAFDMARNRVDEIFYANQLRLNGEKFTKKSKQMSVGDYVDIVTETREDVTKVKRVKLVKIASEKTRSDKFIVNVKIWRAAFEIENKEKTQW